MDLTSLSIRNFRCIESLDVDVRSMTSLIGPNNCGKSSTLQAIQRLLGDGSIDADDFRSGTNYLEICGTFSNLADWERQASGVAGLVWQDQIQLRVTASLDGGEISQRLEAFYPEEAIEGWNSKYADLSDEIKALLREHGVQNGTDLKGKAKEESARAIVRTHRADLVTESTPRWTDEGVSFKNALKQALPQAIVVPAVRDAVEDGKPGAKTSFGLLLSKVVMPAVQRSSEYDELVKLS